MAENLLPLCRKHHDLVHAKGLSYMAKVFPVVKTWLECAGWTYDEYMRRWYRSDLSRGEVILDGEEDKDHEEGEAHDEGHA